MAFENRAPEIVHRLSKAAKRLEQATVVPSEVLDKLGEADYFLSELRRYAANVDDANRFRYNLRAFLSALRGTINMLNRDFGRRRGFKMWIDHMENNDRIKFLRGLRNADFHVTPINPGYQVASYSGGGRVRVEWGWTLYGYPASIDEEDEDEDEEDDEPKDAVAVCEDLLWAVREIVRQSVSRFGDKR
ncbi:MAG: hypothetical protein HYS09_06555 [Chloroflexi bacterium]|nr:hypothetical protein [Chloroflexota bacterium]